ncbi:hypothetical protein LZC95_32585 [Pendulispora brunnea]|uniref:PE-PGRS family protein n=1 Tax=Pendulispora brunnea TaxID=2905690 RepID=A0ABZ2JXL9_9BACT
MRAWYVASSLIAVAGIAAASFIACDTSEDCTFSANGCGGGRDAGFDSNPQQWPAGCIPAADPGDSLPCVDESVALFVAPKDKGGSEGGAGTKTSPISTLRAALDKVGVRPRIYVCGGNYEEAVTINHRVSIFGGFDCSGGNWTVPKNAPLATNIAPSAVGTPALTIQAVSEAITLMDMSFTSKDATAAGGNSIAGWVTQSSDVTFKRVTFTAGAGKDGDPKDEPKITDPAPAKDGIDADAGAPGGEQPNDCSALKAGNNRSVGAPGGDKGETGAARGGDGGIGLPQIQPPNPNDNFNGVGGQGLASGDVCTSVPGARNGSLGVGGAKTPVTGPLGTVAQDGYHGVDGLKGGDGQTAQGGGGGGGQVGTSGGGGGGAGGCGGQGGAGAQAGGSSIALLVYKTKVHLFQSKLAAAAPGKGGHGGKGQKGQEGGGGSRPLGGGCGGGPGGHGGGGAGGNGGAGGSSIGLAYGGDPSAAPEIDGKAVTAEIASQPGWTTTAPNNNHGVKGTKGDAVSNGKPGEDGNDGPDGIARAAVILQAQ